MICSKGPATVQWAWPMKDQAVPRPVNFNSNVRENSTSEASGQIRTTALGIAPVIGKTTSRRVLGSLNELVFQLESGLIHRPDRSLPDHSLWLARTPMKVIEYAAPNQATAAAFAARQALSKVTRR
jgi:hypothetical protein